MKKLVLLTLSIAFFLLIASFDSVLAQYYLINEGESIVYNGKTIGVGGVSSSSVVVIVVDGIAKAINLGESKTFDGILVKVVEIYYYPNEGEISSAYLMIAQSTIPVNITCEDSDGGIDYYTKGTVSVCTIYDQGGGCSGLVDSCNGNVLTEGYCEDTSLKSVKYTCPYGCSDGSCVKVTCVDYDNSPDYSKNPPYIINPTNYPDLFTKSYGTGIYSGSDPENHQIYGQEPDPSLAKPTTNDYSTYYDYCANEKQLNEAFCRSDGKLGAFGLQCPNGCKDGVCVKETCMDSDGGINYFVKGTLTGTAVGPTPIVESCYLFNPDGSGSPVRECSSNDSRCKIYEHWCESGAVKAEEYHCPYGCVDGRCIEGITTTIPGECWNHAQCSQACDNMGTEKWKYSEKWEGTCPYGVYGCMTRDCCLGQCRYTTTKECFCLHTNKVDIYGDVCPVGTTCGDDCYCHPIRDETKIAITSPKDGQTVSGIVTVVAEASNKNELGEMTLTIQKEGGEIAELIPFKICGGGVACPIKGGECTYMKSCNYDWDTFGYDGEVILTATITSGSKDTSDSVKVSVINYRSCSEQCSLKGYRYGSCKAVCYSEEINIGIDGCPQATCAPCPADQVCPSCPTYTCCCAGKRSCPYECCVNDPNYLDKPCPPVACPECVSGEECPPCIQPSCIDHRCSWHPEEQFVLKFRAGWNMFSFPVDVRRYLTAIGQPLEASEITVEKAITGKVTETAPIEEIPFERKCPSPAHIWHYSNGRYIDVTKDPTSIVNGWGYWVRMDYDCIAKVTGNKITIHDFPELDAGWNQIGAPSESVNFYTVIGNCNLLSGPWWFDSYSKKYTKTQVLKPGEAYFLKVKDRCTLGSEIPPLPPEELGWEQAFRVK